MMSLTPGPDPNGVSRNPNNHSSSDVLAALTAGVRQFQFHYTYRANDGVSAPVTNFPYVESCTVTQNWLADIKRTCDLVLKDTGNINYASGTLQPYVRLLLPPYGVNDWVEWPQGIFLLSSPSRVTNTVGAVTREVTGYDLLQGLSDDIVNPRYALGAGFSYYTQAYLLLQSSYLQTNYGLGFVGANNTTTCPLSMEWPPGTSKLEIINSLLSAINYNSVYVDEDGYFQFQPYVLPAVRTSEYTYADNAQGLMLPDMEQDLDLFEIPNSWVLVASNPDQSVITATYTNSNPASPTSTVNRGRTIVSYQTVDETVVTSQSSLQTTVNNLAFQASQVFTEIQFSGGMLPIHSGNDCYTIQYGPLQISDKFTETQWTMELAAGTPMTHTARRVVSV